MMGSKTRVAFGLVLIVALLAAHTASATRTIVDGAYIYLYTHECYSCKGRGEETCPAALVCVAGSRACALAA